jgi:hypothetical protein
VTAPRTSSFSLRSLALPGLLLFLGSWGVWAILLDQHPEYSDTMFYDAINLWRSFVAPEQTLFSSFTAANYHPPLCFLPASLLFLITGPGLTVLRLTVLMQYLASVWLAHDLGRRMAGDSAGLLSAVLLGTFQLIFGWGRMGYMDMGVTLMVLLALRFLSTCDFNSYRSGIKLGAAVGLGMLSKIAFPLFAIGPLSWALLTRIRSRRQLSVLGAAAAASVVVCGWWYLLQWRAIMINFQMSSTGPSSAEGIHRALTELTLKVDGGIWLLALALVGSVVAWRLRTVPARGLALLSLALWPSFALLLLFHPLRRYALPIYAVAAILAGVSLQSILARFSSRLANLGTAALALFLLGNFTWFNLGAPADLRPVKVVAGAGFRMDDLGLLSPDRRRVDAYPSALQAIDRRFTTCLVVFTGSGHHELHLSRDLRLRFEADRRVRLVQTRAELGQPTGPVCVLLVTDRSGKIAWREQPQNERVYLESCQAYAWFEATRNKRLLGTWGPSPLGLRYLLHEIDPAALPRADPRPDYCRLKFNIGDTL